MFSPILSAANNRKKTMVPSLAQCSQDTIIAPRAPTKKPPQPHTPISLPPRSLFNKVDVERKVKIGSETMFVSVTMDDAMVAVALFDAVDNQAFPGVAEDERDLVKERLYETYRKSLIRMFQVEYGMKDPDEHDVHLQHEVNRFITNHVLADWVYAETPDDDAMTTADDENEDDTTDDDSEDERKPAAVARMPVAEAVMFDEPPCEIKLATKPPGFSDDDDMTETEDSEYEHEEEGQFDYRMPTPPATRRKNALRKMRKDLAEKKIKEKKVDVIDLTMD